MKFIRLFICCSLAVFLMPIVGSADLSGFACNLKKNYGSSEAQEKLKNTQKWYSNIGSLKAEFKQHSYLAALDIAEESSGSVILKKPGMMRWLYRTPENQDFLVKDNTYWLYREADNQVLVDNFRSVLISDLPVAFLMGLGDLSKQFKIKHACQTEKGTVFDLVPSDTNDQKPASSTELQNFALLVGSRGEPIGAQVSDMAGNVTSILLNSVNVSVQLSDQEFKENFPKSADYFDRRELE
jgi:outer membrane lipoprotein carrier protein